MSRTLQPISARVWVNALAIAVCGCIFSGAAHAQVTEPIAPPTTPNTVISNLNSAVGYVRAKASPDECWTGLNQNTLWNFLNLSNPTAPCNSNQIPKVNQGYIWGQVLVGDQIYFGTFANPECLAAAPGNSNPKPVFHAGSWTCEYADSPLSITKGGPLPPSLGDDRPPRMYVYDIPSQTIRDITPKLGGAPPAAICGPTGTDPLCTDNLWNTTLGIRSAASYTEPATGKTYVIVSGQALVSGPSQNAANFFVWGISENRWVGKFQLVGVSDSRHWLNYQGVLYVAAFKPGSTGGALMRYTGNMAVIPPSAPSALNLFNAIPLCGSQFGAAPVAGAPNCVAFQDVGDFDTPASEVTVAPDGTPDAGRIFVGTWAPVGANPNNGVAGIYMSPVVPQGGLTPANASQWAKVWNVGNYDPDPTLRLVYGMGAMTFYNGYLYWGTLNPTFAGPMKLFTKYGTPTDQRTLVEWALKGSRPAVLFRAQGFSTPAPFIDLLYGETKLPVLIPPSSGVPGEWVWQANNVPNLACSTACGTPALFGHSGFNDFWTNYMWSMAVINQQLYVGTMDWSFLVWASGFRTSNPQFPAIPDPGNFGGDLYYFPDVTHAAIPVSKNGVGNFLNYGIRNIIPYSSTRFFIGTANPMNIATSGNTNVPGAACDGVTYCRGGWELIEVDPGGTAF
jgi:hypothetical protein